MKQFLLKLHILVLCILLPIYSYAEDDPLGSIQKTSISNKLNIHTYISSEAQQEVSTIFETEKTLVLLEPQSMQKSAIELKNYIRSLQKPLKGIIVSYHGAGLDHFPGIPVYASKATIHFMQSGQAAVLYEAQTQISPAFDTSIKIPDRELLNKAMMIGDIKFEIFYHDNDAVPGVDLAIPKAKAFYQHMLGGDSHSVINSPTQIDQILASLIQQKKEKYSLMLSSHHSPETAIAIDQKIIYLEKMKTVISKVINKNDFILAMKTAFPGLKNEQYLDITATTLYPATD